MQDRSWDSWLSPCMAEDTGQCELEGMNGMKYIPNEASHHQKSHAGLGHFWHGLNLAKNPCEASLQEW